MSEPLPDCCVAEAPTKTNWAHVGGFILAVFGLFLFLETTGLARFSPSVGSAVGLGSVIVIGFASALSSCGALMTALVAASDKPAAFHLRFHAGRLAGFAALGAVLGLIGRSIAFSPAVSGVLVILVAVVMVAYGLKMFGAFPARLLSFKAPRFVSRLTDSPLLLGAATFFLPCGFMQSIQLYAASTGSPSKAALILFLFALGSLPPLLGIGMAAQAGRKRSTRFNAAAGILVATIGILNGQNGLALLGVTGPNEIASPRQSSGLAMTDETGAQLIQMEVTSAGTYEPSTLTVQAGAPVRWQVERGDDVGCGSTLVFREAGINAALKPGLNELTFTPKKPGRYPFTCSMGMFRGTMIVVPKT